MNDALALLIKSERSELTREEEDQLFHELSVAYHRDESAVINPEVTRIVEKIRLRLQHQPGPENNPPD